MTLEQRLEKVEYIQEIQTLAIDIIAKWMSNHIGLPKDDKRREVIENFSVQYLSDNKNEILEILHPKNTLS